MATRNGSGSSWAQCWITILQHVKNAYGIAKRAALKSLNYLIGTDRLGMNRPFELMFRLYELNNRINGLPPRRQIIVRSMLITSFGVFTSIAIYFIGTAGGIRRAINTSIGTFEYPSLPTRSRKIFYFFKISFGFAMVYNIIRYFLDVYTERVALMNRLEEDATLIIPGQSRESRLDSTVPRVGDGCKTKKARQLIAMRRLFHRGQFKFDVVPEPDPVRVYKPRDVMQALPEIADLQAVRHMFDPRILRECIRRRESRRARRGIQIGKINKRPSNSTLSSRTWTMPRALYVIEEEDSESQSSTSAKWSDASLESSKSMKSHSAQTDSTASTSTISWCMSKVPPTKADGDRFSSQKGHALKTPPTLSARQGIGNYIPGMPQPLPHTPLRDNAGPANVNPTNGARATEVGATKAPAERVVAGTERSAPLQRKTTRSTPTPPSTPAPQSTPTPTSISAPQRITPPGTHANQCVTPPRKPSPTSLTHMPMDMDVMAKGGGETLCRSATRSLTGSFVSEPATQQQPTKPAPGPVQPVSAHPVWQVNDGADEEEEQHGKKRSKRRSKDKCIVFLISSTCVRVNEPQKMADLSQL